MTQFYGMKIALDIRGIEGKKGGKGIWTLNTLKALLETDKENTYCLYGNNENVTQFKNSELKIIKGSGILWHLKLYKKLIQDNIDCFLATESYIIPFLHNPKKLKVGLVVHDLVAFKSPAKHQKKATFIEKITLKKAAKKSKWIFTVSDYTRKDLIEKFPEIDLESKTNVIHAGVRNIFSERKDSNQIVNIQRRYNLDPDYIMMAGTLEPRKNILRALQAFKLIDPKLRQQYRFVIVGKKGWYYQKIFETVKDLGLTLRVKFLEYIPDEDLVTLMQGSKVFLFPSLYEGFGLPILEAMTCGVPVLASRVTSIPELGVDAIHYADPYDPVDIADGITQLLKDDSYRKTLQKKGFEQIKNFGWNKTAGKILNEIS